MLVKSLRCLILPMFGKRCLFIMSLRKHILIICAVMFEFFLSKFWFILLMFLIRYLPTCIYLIILFLTLLCLFNCVKNSLWQCQKISKLSLQWTLFTGFLYSNIFTYFFCLFTLHCFILKFKYNTINKRVFNILFF